MNTSAVVRLASEGRMAFATYGGKIELKLSGEALTPFGGLVPWAAFEKHTGILKQLAATCPVERTSPNAAPVYDVLCSFALTALCDGTRFNHVQRLREDPTVCEICGLKAVVGDAAAVHGNELPVDAL